ncbi:MAG: NAD(P)-dependent oxidoreductase, partial [Candidatus Binatia bacterium]
SGRRRPRQGDDRGRAGVVEVRAMRVGFVGLGNMGAPMARRIAEAGWPLAVFARRPATLDRVADLRPTVAPSLRALGEASDLVGICVVDDREVEDVLLGQHLVAGLRPGAIVAVHSTVHPETCRRLAARAAEKHVALLDAPVSGGPAAVAARRLSVIVGGKAEAFESARPVFESFAGTVRHVGAVGSGQTAKLVNNLLFMANLGLAAEAMGLGAALGVDAPTLAEVVRASSGSSFALDLYAPSLSLDSFAAVAGLLRKDLDLALDVARAAGLDASSLSPAAEWTVRTLERLAAAFGRRD